MDAPNIKEIFLEILFPNSQEERTQSGSHTIELSLPPIADREFALAIENIRRKNTTPRPEGISCTRYDSPKIPRNTHYFLKYMPPN